MTCLHCLGARCPKRAQVRKKNSDAQDALSVRRWGRGGNEEDREGAATVSAKEAVPADHWLTAPPARVTSSPLLSPSRLLLCDYKKVSLSSAYTFNYAFMLSAKCEWIKCIHLKMAKIYTHLCKEWERELKNTN